MNANRLIIIAQDERSAFRHIVSLLIFFNAS